jgi:hypothetical protein
VNPPVRSSAPAFATTALALGALCACGHSHGATATADGGALGESGVEMGAADDASTGNDAGGASGGDAALPSVAGVRLAIWAASPLPAVDFCVAPHGTTAFIGPMLHGLAAQADSGGDDAGVVEGLTYPLVSSYFSVPVGQYDARVVAAGAGDCRVGVFPDAADAFTVGPGGTETIALLDDDAPDAGALGVRITAFGDDGAGGDLSSVSDADVPVQGRPLIRFINASPSEPLVDLGVGLDSNPPSYTTIFLGVAFGQHSTLSETTLTPADTDDQGYLSFASITGKVVPATGTAPAQLTGATFGARRTRTDTMLATATFFGSPGAVITLALVPIASGSTDAGSTGSQILICFDSGGTGGSLSTCSFSP